MRKLLFAFLLFTCSLVQGQSYNNEWIDYSKTYYRFKLAQTGLYRIAQGALPAALAGVPAEQFQLWRNGKQVTLYTSVAAGPLGAGGYIEFWGRQNDGEPDKPMYLVPAYQFSDRVSLETDTASFFLTVNPNIAANARFLNQANDVAGNTLPAQQYFMHTARHDFRQMINRGKAAHLGLYVYSSSYDEGEWWSSNEFRSAVQPSASSTGSPAQPLNYTFNDLKPFTAGPTSSLRLSVAGTAPNGNFLNPRMIRAQVNSNTLFNNRLDAFDAAIMSGAVTTTTLSNNTQVAVHLDFTTTQAADRAVVGFLELTYPRNWDFNNQNSFEFSLPATAAVYFEITNFNAGSSAPVLYDLTNNRRYVADIAVAGRYRFVLPADAARNFVLVSQTAGITSVSSFQQKNFVNYTTAGQQGDYLIITNNVLRAGGDPVEQYRAYRSSVTGGAYNGKIYDIDELTDQFAFGIRKHPLAIKNFIRFARNNFSTAPKQVFIIGRGVTYDEYYAHQGSPEAEKLNMVPTFGYPGSDILLASNGLEPVPAVPIGRLAAIQPQEVTTYLDKVVAYEQAQRNPVQTIAEKSWMKNVVHVAGADDPGLDASLTMRLNGFKAVITDTFYGARVYDFNKSTTGPATVITDALLSSLLKNGLGMLTYFGHGSSTNLAYNLPSPATWNNQGKYPLFMMLGCNVGNFFGYDLGRLTVLQTLSERYILTPQLGGIGMIASTHFGTEYELDAYAQRVYQAIGRTKYNQPVSLAMQEATQQLQSAALTSFIMRLHLEQHLLHGDPAIKPNSFPKPDYAIEESQVLINPSFISVADTVFSVKAYFHNLAKAVGHAAGSKVSVEVKRRYPDASTAVVYTKDISPAIRNLDSINFTLPIVPTRDKGENRLIVTIDYANQYDELSETNNTTEKTFFVFENELRPVYPYNFAIINKNTAKLVASTADPLLGVRGYVMELDTTELFNSPFRIVRTITSAGGVIEFDPGISFQDSVVYYWRVAIASLTGAPHWNNASFVYLPGTNVGFNQSHFYQHTKSAQERMYIDSADRRWKFRPGSSLITITNAVWQRSGFGDGDFAVDVNGVPIARSNCVGHSITFSLIDPLTMKPYYNQSAPSIVQSGTPGGFMGSGSSATCVDNNRKHNFEFGYMDTTGRRRIRDFLDWVPNNVIVVARLTLDAPFESQPYVDVWKADAAVYGTGNTMYDRLKSAGFVDLDSFTYPRTWAFVYKKNATDLLPDWRFSAGLFDKIDRWNVTVTSSDTLGYVTSPKFGPAAAWKEVKWRGSSLESPSTDEYTVNVIGVRQNGQEDVLYTLNAGQQVFDISTVNPSTYPFIRLKLFTGDKQNLTPYQLRWWRVYYTAVPEGGLAANLKFNFKDTLEAGELLNLAIPFKNVSDVAFTGPIKVNISVRDKNNQQTQYTVPRLKAIALGDTAMLNFQLNTQALTGNNTILVDVNPDNDQPEHTHFNNFFYRTFVVRGDLFKPTLDVTFDGVRILNNDIVSAKPHILVKLRDESKFLPLDDTSLVTIMLRYPDNSVRRFRFGTDTLKFTAATPGGTNEATVDFTPSLPMDGEYELIVSAKDKSGNPAGTTEYRVLFQVFNKAMITNLFNYPNPFTSSTAFVFTLTGSVVPQQLKIQILTVTGKVVREITKDELGPLNIGRNITEFKWDGTDRFGQKLANGVYLYRVVTNLNGKSLEKFPTFDPGGAKTDTDQYFNKGYGKMYLMR